VNFVGAVKAVRAMTGFGLKEAKLTMDDVRSGKMFKVPVSPNITQQDFEDALSAFVASGGKYDSTSNKEVVVMLNEAAKLAIDDDSPNLAIEILNLIVRYQSVN